MNWTYTLNGSPDGATQTALREQDEPGHIIVQERIKEPGICDLWVLVGRNDTYRAAFYDWKASGTPEQVMPLVPEALKDLSS